MKQTIKLLSLLLIAIGVTFISSCGDDEGEVTVSIDPISVGFSQTSATVAENDETTTITIAFSEGAPVDASFNISVSGTASYSTDYTTSPDLSGGSAEIAIAMGDISTSFTFTPVDDEVVDGDKSVTFTLSSTDENVEIGSDTFTVTIDDNEGLTNIDFASSSHEVVENDGAFSVSLTLGSTTSAAGTAEITVTGDVDAISTEPATAADIITLNAAIGVDVVAFTVTPIDDTDVADAREIVFTLSSATGGLELGSSQLTYTLTILEDDVPTITSLDENFQSTTQEDGDVFDASDWINFAEAGSQNWEIEFYNDNWYVEFTSYQTDEASNIGWLVLPKINFDALEVSEMSFRNQIGYGDENTLFQLYYSPDFDGVDSSIPAATWNEISGWNKSSTDNVWVESGAIDLSSLTGQGYLAFRYEGNTNSDNDASYRVDNILVGIETPTLTITESLADFGEVENGATSSEQSFEISGVNIDGDVTVTASSGFEVSMTAGAGFASSIAISDVLNTQSVFVRFAPTSGINGEKSGTIAISANNVSAVSIAVSGTEIGNSAVEATGTELYISEYAEGSSNNKYLEIYNPTADAIDLTQYAFPNTSNDPETVGQYEYWNSFPEGATVAPGDVYVIAHPEADAIILAEADYTFQYLSNGDDGFALVKGTEGDYSIIDWLGNWDGDPGSGWDVAGIANATQDHILIRKPEISSGNTDWSASAGTSTEDSEWTVLDVDTWTDIGAHTTTADPLD